MIPLSKAACLVGSNIRWALALLLMSLALSAPVTAQSSSAKGPFGGNLFLPLDEDDPHIGGSDSVRARRVAVDLDSLLAVSEDQVRRFNLFDDVILEGIFQKQVAQQGGRVGWTGTLADGTGQFALVVGPTLVVGNVNRQGVVYQIRFVRKGVHEVREGDHSGHAGCANGPDQLVHEPGDEEEGDGFRSGSDFDVMIVWTADARSDAGGRLAINSLAELAVLETNQAYENSQINSRLRLVYRGEVGYGENGSFGDHLSRLRSKSDGYMDDIHNIRASVGADMVSLFVRDGAYCGIAYLMTSLSNGFRTSAFSVVHQGCATGYYSFGHELGHNQGCCHDRGNCGGGVFSYSYGHRFYGNSGNQYRTVMSYSPGKRIQHLSNPNVDYDGVATGIDSSKSTSADNALSINNATNTISGWYQERFATSALLFSTTQGSSAGGVSWSRSDLVQVDLYDGSVSMVIDLSDVIAGSPNLDAVARLNDGSYLMSFATITTVAGLSGGPSGEQVRPEDLVQFVPSSLGPNTAGSFSFYFDGSDVGLGTEAENVDAVSVDEQGDLHISLVGPFSVTGVSGKDEDVVEFMPTSLGSSTAGTWSMRFDGSDSRVKLGQRSEDVNGYHVFPTNDMGLTTVGKFSVPPAVEGQSSDVIIFIPTSLGSDTSGFFGLNLNGAEYGIGSLIINAIHVLQ